MHRIGYMLPEGFQVMALATQAALAAENPVVVQLNQRLAALAADISEVSRAEEGRIPLSLSHQDLDQIVTASVAAARHAYDADGAPVEFGDHCYRADQYAFDFTVHER